MMAFITLVASITVSILLSSAISFMIMTNQKVMKWFMKYFTNSMLLFDDFLEEDQAKGQ